MKKLLVLAAVVFTGIVSQAAAVKWSSGAVYLPNEDGSLSGNKLTSASGYTLSAYAWESATSFSFNAGDLYNWYANGMSGQAITGLDAITGSVTMGASGTTATATGSDLGQGVTVYGAVLYVLTDTKGTYAYMENSGSKANGPSIQTLGQLANLVGGAGGSVAAEWTMVEPVPEPTSGMLLMLGVGLMALKRRR